MTLIPNRAEGKLSGLNPIGFDVAPGELARLLGRFEKWGLQKPGSRAGKRSFADLRGTDPDGNNMDISTHGFPTGKSSAVVSLMTGRDIGTKLKRSPRTPMKSTCRTDYNKRLRPVLPLDLAQTRNAFFVRK